MKLKQYIIVLFVLAVTLYSCKDEYLDVKSVNAQVSIDQLYSTYTYAKGGLWSTYSYLPNGFSELGRESATDNAELTDESSSYQMFNTGIWNQFSNADDVWAGNFAGIRQANLFLENYSKINISYIKNGVIGTDSTAYFNARNNVKFMKGEVLFLKAFFYFELVKRYGGVPILNEPFDYDAPESWKNVKRNSLDECIKYIGDLCDQAAAIIPANLTPYTWYEAGRVTNGTVLALKSRLLLYAASPLYKENGSTATWVDAAKAANAVIVLNKYSLVTAANYTKLFGSSNTTQTEVIFYRRYGAINSIESANYPIVYDKNTGKSITPSQNLADAFEVVTKNAGGAVVSSAPFNWNNPVHANAPYTNRDARLAASIAYNGMAYKSVGLQTYTGGSSGLPNTNATKTGYYLMKWVNTSIDLVNNTTANHSWVYFRYAETLLNYSEAMFNAYGANSDPLNMGMTALVAFNKVRTRAGLPAITAEELTQARIENERNVEFCFEDQRYWDVRRWKKAESYFGSPVKKIVITNTGTIAAPVYTYQVKDLEPRTFSPKMYWYPIPQTEITKTGWTQNPSW